MRLASSYTIALYYASLCFVLCLTYHVLTVLTVLEFSLPIMMNFFLFVTGSANIFFIKDE